MSKVRDVDLLIVHACNVQTNVQPVHATRVVFSFLYLEKLTFAFSLTRFFPARRCLNRTCLLRIRAGKTFSPVHRPWESKCRALQTDRQTDGRTGGRQDDANNRVAARSAKNRDPLLGNVSVMDANRLLLCVIRLTRWKVLSLGEICFSSTVRRQSNKSHQEEAAGGCFISFTSFLIYSATGRQRLKHARTDR